MEPATQSATQLIQSELSTEFSDLHPHEHQAHFGSHLHHASAAEQAEFELAMASGATATPSHIHGLSPGIPISGADSTNAAATLGDAILDGLAHLKETGTKFHDKLVATVGKGELTSGDLLKLQYEMVHMNLELQTTANMAHHGVEDVKTIMRGQ